MHSSSEDGCWFSLSQGTSHAAYRTDHGVVTTGVRLLLLRQSIPAQRTAAARHRWQPEQRFGHELTLMLYTSWPMILLSADHVGTKTAVESRPTSSEDSCCTSSLAARAAFLARPRSDFDDVHHAVLAIPLWADRACKCCCCSCCCCGLVKAYQLR